MFGVEVFKSSKLDCRGPSAFGIYMCIGLYIYRSAITLDLAVKHIWCSSMQGIYAQFPVGVHLPLVSICALVSIYIDLPLH